jgi:hypothetical protein
MNLNDPKKQRAAALLAKGYRTGAVAGAVRIRPETLSRWKAEPDFQALMQAAIDAKDRADLETRLAAAAPDALDTLTHAMQQRDANGGHSGAAVAAAGLILKAAILNPKRPQPKEPPHDETQEEPDDL